MLAVLLIPALGIPGAKNWKSEWAEYLEGIGSIYVWQEPGLLHAAGMFRQVN